MQSNTRQKTFDLENEITARVTYKEPQGDVVNIEIYGSKEKYKEFLKHFKQKNISWKTSCYTYILQSNLTHYRYEKLSTTHHAPDKDKKIDQFMNTLQLCSEQLIKLEALINNPRPDKNGHDNIKMLKDAAIDCFGSVLDILELEEQTPVLQDFIIRIKERKKSFIDELTALQERTATPEEIRLLFSIQDETQSIHSLGNFVADELTLLTECGIQQTYWITDNRFTQLFFTHPAIKALSQAKSQIERRAYALQGARYNNSRDPVPADMLEVMNPTSSEDEGWFSLMPYLSSNKDFEEVDKMLCLMTNKKFNDRTTGRNALTFMALAGANMVEVLVYFPIHIALSVISFSVEVLSFQLINMSWLDDAASFLHEKLSLTSLVKQSAQNRYQRLDTDEAHNNLLSSMTNHVENIPNKLISGQSGHKLAGEFYSLVQKIMDDVSMKKPWRDFSILFLSSKEKNKKFFEETEVEVKKEWSDFSKKLIEEIKSSSEKKKEEHSNPEKHFHPAKEWRTNELNLSGDFLEEMIVVGADEVVDHAFRNSPGVATSWFIASAATWSVLMIPTLSANHKLAWAKIVPELISEGFRGKEISGVFSKQIATFMLWKLGYFSSEMFLELTYGNTDKFFQDLFQKSEVVSLGITVLVLSGMAIKYLPEASKMDIPSFHFSNPMLDTFAKQTMAIPTITMDVFNKFREESAVCAEGQTPFNFLEYSLLSLKLGMLTHAAFLSGHENHSMNMEKLSALGESLQKNKILECKDPIALRSKLNTIFKENALPVDDAIIDSFVHEITSYEPQFKSAPPTSDKTPIDKAWTELHDAINLINQMENLPHRPLGEVGSRQSFTFYNHLDTLFENYNQLLRDKKCFHQLIHKQDYLDPFYNKYCYKSGMPFFRLLSILPIPPFILITYSWRGLKYLAASTDYFSSPATIRQVNKSFNKDAAIFMQLIGAIARPVRAFARVVDYLGRIMVGSVVIAVTKTGVLSEGTKYNAMKDVISLNLHRANFTSTIRPWYARATRDAGTASSELCSKNNMLLERLERDKKTILVERNGSNKDQSHQVMQTLLNYHTETQHRRIKRTSADRPGQLAQLSEIWSRTDLQPKEKQVKSETIINALPKSSLLRKKMTKHISPAANDPTIIDSSLNNKRK